MVKTFSITNDMVIFALRSSAVTSESRPVSIHSKLISGALTGWANSTSTADKSVKASTKCHANIIYHIFLKYDGCA